jgi:hypothetical protein
MATTISRDHVAWNGRRFDFSSALTLMLELDDIWCYDCPSLGLLGCAPSREDAIACESDDVLLPQARDLKLCGTKYLTTMARQLGLKRDELMQLVECPLSRDEYETLLRERGKL